MKKILLSFLTLLVTSGMFSQTATNFHAYDCAGTDHDLFNELDAGKVVVICWVMPCAGCIGPALSGYTEVQNYDSSHPGRVLFYIADDYSNTSCSSVTTWAATNGMSGADAIFSIPALDMDDYGGPGMPKTVVLGGTSHTIFFNENNTLNVSNLNNAINAALTTGIQESATQDLQMSVSPNPSSGNGTNLRYSLTTNENVGLVIYNMLGAKVKEFSFEKQIAGIHETKLSLEALNNGIYFMKLTAGTSSQTIKFTIEH